MKREDLSEALSALQSLVELGDTAAEEGCLQVVEAFPDAHEFWALRSRALSIAGRGDEALHDITTACKLDPTNVTYMFHYFNVRIQLSQPQYIVSHINHRFPSLDADGKALLLGYVKEGLRSGLFSKLELSNEVLGELCLQ